MRGEPVVGNFERLEDLHLSANDDKDEEEEESHARAWRSIEKNYSSNCKSFKVKPNIVVWQFELNLTDGL